MHNSLNSLFVLVLGFVLGSINWFLLYNLYKKVFDLSSKEKSSKKDKIKILLMLLTKVLFLFAGLYAVIVVFKFNVLYLLLGLIISLICMMILMLRVKK